MLLDMPQSAVLGRSQDRVLYIEWLESIDLWCLFQRHRRHLLKAFIIRGTRYGQFGGILVGLYGM